MSKILYVCYRESLGSETERKVEDICKALNAGNILSNRPNVFTKGKISYGITNPTSTLETRNENVLLGKLFGEKAKWHEVGEAPPNGNFAIFRANAMELEVLTDCLGSRSVFYYLDEKLFIASTSQRAIIKFLGNFVFDERVIPWIISTGSLGPCFCWDQRIKMAPSDGALILDRNKWTLQISYNPVEFSPLAIPEEEQEQLLKKALIETFNHLDIDLKRWGITLSGGHDSRAILLLFEKYSDASVDSFQTITWGTKKALLDKESDAYIAALVSRKIGTRHRYFETELSDKPVETVVNAFLHNGEGRIDHITGYLDSFVIWKKICESGIEGIIRGDEVFGYNRIYSQLAVRSFMGLTLCSDFSNLEKYPFITNLSQETPDHLKKRNNESLSTWRDRIFQSYRIPFIQSSLAEAKNSYVEQVNPFLSNKIVRATRRLSDKSRTNKKLFKKVLKEFDIDLSYSKRDSNPSLIHVLRHKEFVEFLEKELSSESARALFPEEFLYRVLQNLKTRKDNSVKNQKEESVLQKLKSFVPIELKKILRQKKSKLCLDENLVAFRLVIIIKMHTKLSSSAV